MTTNGKVQIRDIGAIAYLRMRGIHPLNTGTVDRTGFKPRVIFEFAHTAQLDECVREYGGTVPLAPKELLKALGEVKREVFERLREAE